MFSIGKPSKKKFAMLLCEAIQSVKSEISFRYDSESFSLISEGDEEQTVNLTNLYEEYCSLDKADRETHLQNIASIFAGPTELPEDFGEAKKHLRPKIWNRSTFEFMELKRRIDGGESVNFPLYPVGTHLYSTLVYDTENAMRSLSKSELEAWGVSYYEALEIACQNLEETTVAFAKIGDHFYSSETGDSYDSSRVMLIDRLRDFEVRGERIAIVPQREAMFMAGSEDEQSLSVLFDFTEKTLAEDPRPLCPLPMRMVDGEWVDWQPPKNHVLRKRYDQLELHFLGGLYNEQKEMLDEIFEFDMDNAAFVASFSAMQREGEDPVSYCVWGEGVDSLLPRTQLVMFVGEAGVLASNEWEVVADVVGDLLVPDESYYPIRYRAKEFPNAEQLEAIGTLEL